MKYTDYLKFWMNVLFHPGKSTKRALGVKAALKLYYTLSIIPIVLGLIVVYAVGGFSLFGTASSMNMFRSTLPALFNILSTYRLEIGMGYLLLLLLVVTPIDMFINSGIYHLLIGKLFKLYKKKYSSVFTASVYGELPALLVYWLYPFGIIGSVVVGIFSLWGFVVQIISLSNQLGMSRIKSLGTVILYVAVVAVVAIIIAVSVALVSVAALKVF